MGLEKIIREKQGLSPDIERKETQLPFPTPPPPPQKSKPLLFSMLLEYQCLMPGPFVGAGY